MRLLNVETLRLEEFPNGEETPPYTILSHCWGEQEVSFQDLQSGNYLHLRGFQKLSACCRRSQLEQYRYTWIDTCCIDKTSSAELSEAINSMFRWYQLAAVCYAYLQDVSWDWQEDTWPSDSLGHESGGGGSSSGGRSYDPYDDNFAVRTYRSESANVRAFKASRWFRRGWTLQELVAPDVVVFFDQRWREIGTKTALAGLVSEITGIDKPVLCNRLFRPHPDGVLLQLRKYTVATRMSWASMRETTRPEDEAYCLFGIFEVNLPLIYGEGEKAFFRLQQEIMRDESDATMLLWDDDSRTPDESYVSSGALAPSPRFFASCLAMGLVKPARTYGLTSPTTPATAALRPGVNRSLVALEARFFSLKQILALPKQVLPTELLGAEPHDELVLMSRVPRDAPGTGRASMPDPTVDGDDNGDDDPDADRMTFYIAILSATKTRGPVGILLAQQLNGVFARCGSIWKFPEHIPPHAAAAVPKRACTKLVVAKTTAGPPLRARRVPLPLSWVAHVHASYQATEAHLPSHSSADLRTAPTSPLHSVLFRSAVPDTLPTFAVAVVVESGEVGFCTIPADSRTGQILPHIKAMPMMRETMRAVLVPGQYDVVVSFRTRSDGGSPRARVLVAMEAHAGAADLPGGDERRLWTHPRTDGW